ncbi:MAG: hypothetical protein KKE77_10530 [Alphaproteobacteria bacterium]|nr:hypothetical protein [Alphaproteobacteria bacterium]
MTIEVELDAYVIPDDHRIWKSTAGKTHRFYRAVRDANAIFPDIRGLDLLEGEPSKWSDKDLLELIRFDRWQRENDKDGDGNTPPKKLKVHKTDRATLTFLKRLWFEAKEGDLIVVPPDGWREPALVGEIISEPGAVRAVDAKDGEFEGTFYGRAVKWKEPLYKQDVTPDLLKALHTRTAVFAIGESLKEEVYRHAYGNFVYRNRYVCEFKIGKQRFTTDDSVAVSIWLNGLDVLRNALEAGSARDGESFAQLGLDQLPDNLAAEMKISIQSPGEIFVRTAGPFALSLMTLFALSGCDEQRLQNNEVTVKLKQVGSGDEGARSCIENDVNALKTALGANRLPEANCFAERARKDAKMTTRAILKPPQDKSN